MAKLYFYYSAMNAGKSTTLLQSAHNYRERGMRPLLLAPALLSADKQTERLEISSRIGLHSPAIAWQQDTDLRQLVRSEIARDPVHCVLVDEAQFLSPTQVKQLSDIVDGDNIPVLAYGLRTDFRGELFPGSMQLLAWADELREIKTICESGSKATMVLRINQQGDVVTDGAQVEIGGNDRYVSVSRAQFKQRFGTSA
jgi:thymidine kinase